MQLSGKNLCIEDDGLLITDPQCMVCSGDYHELMSKEIIANIMLKL